MIGKIIERSISSLTSNGVEINRDHWIKDAVDCEKAGSILTCQIIIKNVLGVGVEEEDRKDTWLEVGRTFLRKKTAKKQNKNFERKKR